MATQLQMRRGTQSEHSSFTGAEGEVSVNTTNDSLHVHDGSTASGFELARVDGSNWAITNAISTTANISFGDNDKAIFGAGSDLQIFHNGTESFIREVGTGGLKIDSNGPDLTLRVNATESAIVANSNGSVDLYYDNALKLATTATGIDVTGVITTDGMTTSADINFGDNDKAVFGAGSDLQIYHDGSNSYIDEVGTGTLRIRGHNQVRITDTSNNIAAIFKGDAESTLYHNNSAKLATTATGIDVTGSVTADGLTVDTDTLHVDAANNRVGIGTSSPSEKLEIRNDVAASTDLDPTAIKLYNNNDGGSAIEFSNGVAAKSKISFGVTSTGAGTDDSYLSFSTGANAGLSEAMRIDASGNLLVGKSGSSFGTDGFQVNADGQIWATNASASVTAFNRRTTDGAISVFYKDGVSVGSIRSISGDSIGIGNGDAGLRFISSTNRIQPVDMDNGLNSDALTSLGDTNKRFKDLYLSGNVIASGTPSSTVVGVRVNNGGNNFDLINTSCGSATTTKTHILFTNGNGNVGTIKTNGSATSYNSPSDYRLKENIIAMSGATERLKQLAPKRFNFIADADTTVDGFLAHEVQDIVPEAISGTKDAMIDEEYEVTPEVLDDEGNVITEAVMGTRSVPDYQGIDQSKLVPLLVAAIQELEARITQLEN